MTQKILFVDDDPAVLDGYRRSLHREFEIEIAIGAEQGLAVLQERGPFAIVVSDMRMPGMNGVQFLSQVRQFTPHTIRMILTGFSDIEAALAAVNEGEVFRFLTKPCEKNVLAKALTTALVQFQLVTAEKELLENTLMGAIKVLTDVLAAVNPEAFGRSMRITRCVRQLVQKFNLPAPWRFETAALLSQLGCITLDPETIQAAYAGAPMSAEDRTRFDAHPCVAKDLLLSIPRLEPIAWMISQQLAKAPSTDARRETADSADSVVLGAKLLKLAVALDNLRMKGLSHVDAVTQLRQRAAEFGRPVVEALATIEPESSSMNLRKIPVHKLAAGMILQQEVRSNTGVLLVAKGQEVTHTLLMRLESFSASRIIDKEIVVLAPA